MSFVLLLAGGWITRDPDEILLVAMSVCGLQGLLSWGVRSQQRIARDQTLLEVQAMLQDVVNNQLVVIQMADQINRRKPGAVPESAVERSVGVIYEAIASLSHESLHAWSLKYRRARHRRRPRDRMEPVSVSDASTSVAPPSTNAGPVTMPSLGDRVLVDPAEGDPQGHPVSSGVVESDVRALDGAEDDAAKTTLKSMKVPEKK